MRRRSRVATFVGLGLVVAALAALVAVSLTNALVYYQTPTELARSHTSGTVRLYGVVVNDSASWNEATRSLAFKITDGTTTIEVTSQTLPTDLFRNGVAVVLVGHAVGPSRFLADELLVKHSEVYTPLGPGQTMPPDILQQLGVPGSGR